MLYIINHGNAVSGMIGMGFSSGFASGVAGGFVSGFITGAGNLWLGGNGFGQGLLSGFMSGTVAAIIGGAIGGISSGMYAKAHGGNFGDGYFEYHSTVPGEPGISYDEAMRNAKIYNELFAEGDEIVLADRLNKEFGFKAGDLEFGTVTTRPGKKIGLTNENFYFKDDGTISAGYVNGTLGAPETYSMHISPNIMLGDIVNFRAVVGHEIIHAYHISTFGAAYNRSYSESVARNYSYNTYINAGRYMNAFSVIKGYNIFFPSTYRIPFGVRWPIF